MYSEKAPKFFEISTLLLSVYKVVISQHFVAFSEYKNFNSSCQIEQDKKLLVLVTGNKNLVVSDLSFQKVVMKM